MTTAMATTPTTTSKETLRLDAPRSAKNARGVRRALKATRIHQTRQRPTFSSSV